MYFKVYLDAQVNLLELTRIPYEWYRIIYKKLNDGFKSALLSDMKTKKTYSKLEDENIFILEIFKNIEKIRSIDWRVKDNPIFDE